MNERVFCDYHGGNIQVRFFAGSRAVTEQVEQHDRLCNSLEEADLHAATLLARHPTALALFFHTASNTLYKKAFGAECCSHCENEVRDFWDDDGECELCGGLWVVDDWGR